MKGYYEHIRETQNELVIFRNHQHNFVSHFHINLEIYILNDGEQQVTCNGKTYNMTSGTIAFFDSYDIHGYLKADKPCKDSCVILIPYPLLTHFREFRQKLRVASPIIFDKQLTEQLLQVIDQVLLKTHDKNLITAGVDMMLALIEQKLNYETSGQNDDVTLVKKILEFIDNNYQKDAKLSTIANNLGYTEEHLSRVFHKYLNQSIPSYVNGLRLVYVERELKKGEKKLSEIIFDAGFNSFQTYYRNKNKIEK